MIFLTWDRYQYCSRKYGFNRFLFKMVLNVWNDPEHDGAIELEQQKQ